MKNKNIYISSDHAGFDLKTKLLENFPKFYDLGTYTKESVDYPDFAHKLTKQVLKNKKNIGILICGTGVGMSIAANRKKGIRAGLASNSKIARLIRKHNDANVLVLPGRYMNTSEAKKSIQAFLSTKFESGRHKKRINKL
jgi:ribose 5-phosphate isomerase B